MNPVFAEIAKVAAKYSAKLPSFLLGRRYPQSRLDSLILMDISSSGMGASYYYSSQEANCWLSVVNLSVFDFTIDRMEATITVQGGSFICKLPLPELLKAGSLTRVYLKGKSPVAENIAEHMRKSEKADIQIEAYINTPIRSFSLRRHIGDMRNFEIN